MVKHKSEQYIVCWLDLNCSRCISLPSEFYILFGSSQTNFIKERSIFCVSLSFGRLLVDRIEYYRNKKRNAKRRLGH